MNFYCTCIYCNHKANLDPDTLQKYLNEPPSLKNIHTVYDKLRCSNCSKTEVRLYQEDDRLLIDAEQLCRCSSCRHPIISPRLQAMPNISLCAICMEDQEKPARTDPHPMPPPELKKCARCGSPSVVRENAMDGSYFIGCTQFPTCWWKAEWSPT